MVVVDVCHRLLLISLHRACYWLTTPQWRLGPGHLQNDFFQSYELQRLRGFRLYSSLLGLFEEHTHREFIYSDSRLPHLAAWCLWANKIPFAGSKTIRTISVVGLPVPTGCARIPVRCTAQV